MSIDINQHLKEGDPEPSVNAENITLYEMHYSPYCQRVRYTLDYHQIPYDRILINLGSKPSWYLRLNPSGKVPLLLHRGEKMIESEVIMKYVDRIKGPETSLLSVCGEEGFKEALDLSAAITGPRVKLLFSPEPTKTDADAFKAALSNLDKSIKGSYLLGEKLSLADLALIPFLTAWGLVMNRLLIVDGAPSAGVEAVASQWPNVLKYRQLMNQKPYIMKTSFQDDDFAKLVDAHVWKKPVATS
ncbi:Glutathione S-transferase omega-1 [Sparganum proliferum]